MKEIIKTATGENIERIVLTEGDQSVALLSVGGCTQDWRICRNGRSAPIILGYEDPRAYLQNPFWFGAIAGRVANRIGGGGFTLDGQFYPLQPAEDGLVLHGGPVGLARRMFTMETDSAANAVRLTYRSPDGEEGFPATLDITYDIQLKDGVLRYDMQAVPDRATPVALAQHNYYNLMGEGAIWGHHLTIQADRYTPKLPNNLPNGDIVPVDKTRDFRSGATVAEADPNHEGQDANLIFAEGVNRNNPVASLRAPNGLQMQLWSDQPAVQYYTGVGIAPSSGGLDGRTYDAFSGLCLEPQNYPNAVNTPHFPSPICTPDAPYRQEMILRLSETS